MRILETTCSTPGWAFRLAPILVTAALALLLVLPVAPIQAQGSMSLSTVTANNGQQGITFDITAQRSVRLHRFWNTFNTGSGTVEIWARQGGTVDQNSGWIFLGQSNYTATSNTNYTEIPVDLDFMMNPNETWGFMIFCSNGGLRYRSGTTPYVFSDSYMSIDTQFWGVYGTTNPNNNTTNVSFGFYPRQFCGKVTYDEGIVGPNDAGIASIDSPLNFCPGSEDVKVTLRNFGTNQLTSATINWTLNGVPQTAYAWSGLLDTLTTASRETQVTLATMNFLANTPYAITAWTSSPNGVQDTINMNDTASVTVQAAIAGTYTIGGTSPDYATFTDAVDDLNTFGLCGPVVFNVRSGTYNERIELDAIPGASAVNTVTFQSETGNRSDVTVSHTSNSTANNGVLVFGGATFVTFRNMTITNTGTGTYTMVVDMGTSTDCTIESCDLIGATVTTTSNYAAVVNGYGSNNHRTTIRDCNIQNGSVGLYMGGSSNTNTQDDCVYERNTITGSYYTGYYSYYQGYEKFHDNVIELGPGYSYMYLSFFYYGHDASVERNKWFGQGRSYAYGVYFYYQNYYVSGQSRFVNNMITLTGQNTPYRMMYMYRSYNTLFAHNTWWMDGNYSSSYGVYHYYPSGCTYYNNIFYQQGTGKAWYVYDGASMTDSDYNLFYTNGNTLAYWNGNKTTLADLQNSSGMDGNSLTKTVFFEDVTTGDLHLASPSDDDTDLFGTLLQDVTVDIDHDGRVNPYMGADEACYVLPGSLTYEFVDGQGMPAGYAEAPGTIGVEYGITFPEY
ncbi:MAG: right-handed parallel beta-helix repeat-containing protein, partial [Bacteroidetes bacterium]|nr:right-handed parallel beta-helix repeat-containing protein [Bacteroidota bacterium]